jgi:MoxR-like ATPase
VSYSQPGRGAQADDVAGPFAGTASVRAGLAAHGYLADDKIAGVVSLAARLGKPLLVEGPAGTGKTQLAKSVAQLAARPLIRLQCYECASW